MNQKQKSAAWRGGSKLALEAIQGVIELVHDLHSTIASGPGVLGRLPQQHSRELTGLVYPRLHQVAHQVGATADVALEELLPLLPERQTGPQGQAFVAAMNGVFGDHLHQTRNPLAIPMRFRLGGREIPLDADGLRAALPGATGKILVLVHGSSMNDLQWRRQGHDHGAELASDLGYTPVYLHYNSGLHISTNGRALARLLEELVSSWPTTVENLALLGHSMGGLVARSACLAAEAEHLLWRRKLRKLVCLGTPHHGAPLERAGSWLHLLLGVSAYSAPFARLARIRSAGVTDLRFGNVLDEHWHEHDRFNRRQDVRRSLTLPREVDCYAVAATTAAALRSRLPGDGLVPVASALGRHRTPGLHLDFPAEHQLITFNARHLDLLNRADVYARIRHWLAEA